MSKDDKIRHTGATGNQRDARLVRTVELTEQLDFLIDHHVVFRRALGLLGPYLQVASTELIVRRPRDDQALPMHVDGGPGLGSVIPSAAGMLTHLKALYFLTTVSGTDQGGIAVVPGSHRAPSLSSSSVKLADAVEIPMNAGDVILFTSTLWHRVEANRSSQNRVSAVVWYSALWARPIDYFVLPDSVLERLSPRQRLLFGDIGPDPAPNAYYIPTSRDYLQTIAGEEWFDHPDLTQYRLADESFDRAAERT